MTMRPPDAPPVHSPRIAPSVGSSSSQPSPLSTNHDGVAQGRSVTFDPLGVLALASAPRLAFLSRPCPGGRSTFRRDEAILPLHVGSRSSTHSKARPRRDG